MARSTGLAFACLLLAGCGSTTASEAETGPTLPSRTEATEATTEAPASTTAAGPSNNARGNIEKALGEEAGMVWQPADGGPDQPWLTFSIDAITPDVQCNSDYVQEPENGHFVALQLRMSTSAIPPEVGSFTVSPSEFDFIGPDNITVTEVDTFASFTCLADGQQFTQDPLGPGQQYVGQLVLDVPAPSGVIIYRPYIVNGGGGWEWKF
jgi:hypothetical protein